jgi:flagellar motor protein MotB
LSVLSNEFELPVERMSVAGYAATVPIADNNTLGGRQQNRRVDVVFLNASAARSQPGWR